jgi:4-amino-4-deoxy-L-arabinose transferase-like glycosyltransferase
VTSVDKRHIALTAIVLLAFALRIAWISYADYQPTLSDDAGRYDFVGRSLAEGGGYNNPNGNTTMFWPPGYPFLLTAVYKLWPEAAFGDHEVTAALALNAAAGALTCIFIYALARRITIRAFSLPASHLAPLTAAGLYALLPSAIFLAGTTLTETWFTFLLMLALWLLVVAEERASWPLRIAAAITIGYASLVRGPALLLPLVAIPFWYAASHVHSQRTSSGLQRGLSARALPKEDEHVSSHAMPFVAQRLLAVTAIAAACILPWTIRNYTESNAVVAIASNSGVDFYIGHSPGADGRGRIVDELVFRYPDLPPAEAEAEVSNDGFREGMEYALKHPAREIELSLRKIFFLYWHDHEALAWTDAHGERDVMPDRVRDALAAISDLYYRLLMAAAITGIALWLTRRAWRKDPVGVLLLSVVAYWTLIHIAFFADPRFHAPIMPIMCIFAATAFAFLQQRRTPDLSS